MTQFLKELAADPDDLVDGLHHVNRDADGPGLVGDGPGDGLTNPPGSVGGELETLGAVKFFHCLDEAQVSLLDQIQKQHPPAHVTLGDGYHQTEVGLRQLLLSGLAGPVLPAQGGLQNGVDFRALLLLAAKLCQLLFRLVSGGHGLGQADLFLRRQQGYLANFL